jgi:hypothetical protein
LTEHPAKHPQIEENSDHARLAQFLLSNLTTISAPHQRTEGSAREVTLDYTRDTDPVETQEWLDSLEGVIEVEGPERAHYLASSMTPSKERQEFLKWGHDGP